MADALDYAHARGIIHRDIKPENILLAAGHARVADFGIARALSAAEGAHVTQVGLVIGTPAYMSPEQAVGDAVDARSDLYSLGCVLFEMITGAAPFAGAGQAIMMARRFREAPPSCARPGRRCRANWSCWSVERWPPTPPAAMPPPPSWPGPSTRPPATGRGRDRPARPPAPPTPRSIAVLPFVNMSADPENEYFSDGMTEELISVLTKMGGLRVAARSSVFAYKGRSEDARIIGRTLNVDTVLAGSVRKAGGRIRLAAQLTSVADGYQIWADTFDRELSDVFAVQDEISQAIARALQVRLVPGAGQAAGRKGTDDVEAYTLYLRGRFHWGRRTESEIQKGLEHFQKALARDPQYALSRDRCGRFIQHPGILRLAASR